MIQIDTFIYLHFLTKNGSRSRRSKRSKRSSRSTPCGGSRPNAGSKFKGSKVQRNQGWFQVEAVPGRPAQSVD
jgi:hypothetical protein